MRSQNRRVLLDQLRDQLSGWERKAAGYPAEIQTTGCQELDRLLPEGGLRRGTLVEWLAVGRGSCAGTLALFAAREAARSGGALVLFDRRGLIYPPALAAWGLELPRLIIVAPANAADEQWAIDQTLRCPGVAAVWALVEELDGRMFRRWQLAAETSGALGLLVRTAAARNQPSWSDVRWEVAPHTTAHGRKLRVELTRCRGGRPGAAVEMNIDEHTGIPRAATSSDETYPLHRVSEPA